MGIIHGIDQSESQYLRKFINQIIFHPLKKFEKIHFEIEESSPAHQEKVEEQDLSIDAPPPITNPTLRRTAHKKSKL